MWVVATKTYRLFPHNRNLARGDYIAPLTPLKKQGQKNEQLKIVSNGKT